ncbi:MAG: protocatechuate 3,4-dioxygenase subunit alpha [Mycobacteriaceae bacterium]
MPRSERLVETPSQTVGPYLHIGLTWDDGNLVVPRGTPGAVRIIGTLFDGQGSRVPDGLIETWQADPSGRFAHEDDPRGAATTTEPPGFTGFARASTVNGGRFEILTVKPGPVPAEGGRMQAPCLDVSVFARGMLSRSITRIYFPDEDAADAADPVLSAVDPDRRHTLIAVPEDGELRFDIHLQGEHETVFFAL